MRNVTGTLEACDSSDSERNQRTLHSTCTLTSRTCVWLAVHCFHTKYRVRTTSHAVLELLIHRAQLQLAYSHVYRGNRWHSAGCTSERSLLTLLLGVQPARAEHASFATPKAQPEGTQLQRGSSVPGKVRQVNGKRLLPRQQQQQDWK